MPKMYSAWLDMDNASVLLVCGIDPPPYEAGYDPVLLYLIEAESWEGACEEHHRRQGWQPYKPITSDDSFADGGPL